MFLKDEKFNPKMFMEYFYSYETRQIMILITLSLCSLQEEKYLSIACDMMLTMNNSVDLDVKKIFNLQLSPHHIEICVKEFILKRRCLCINIQWNETALQKASPHGIQLTVHSSDTYLPHTLLKCLRLIEDYVVEKSVCKERLGHRMAKHRTRLQMIITRISKAAVGNLTSLFFVGISSSSAKAE